MSAKPKSLTYWKKKLEEPEFSAAPVECFWHVAGAQIFDSVVEVGVIVEVPSRRSRPGGQKSPCVQYWWARVMEVQGYLVRLRYLGIENSSRGFWRCGISLRQESKNPLQHVGRANQNGERYWFPHGRPDPELITNELLGTITLPTNFNSLIKQEDQCKWKPGMWIEIEDPDSYDFVRPVVITKVVSGRLQCEFFDGNKRRRCWFPSTSEFIHNCGWANMTGRKLYATSEYADVSFGNDFHSYRQLEPMVIEQEMAEKLIANVGDCLNMKLEFIDPREPEKFRVGTVCKILVDYHLLIQSDAEFDLDPPRYLCLHATSPYLLPAEFAESNGLSAYFEKPYESFSWESVHGRVPKQLFEGNVIKRDFRVGQYLEAADWARWPDVFPARVKKVVKHLLLIHFEGFDDESDQWYSMSSPELYPIGWCSTVGHPLGAPKKL